MVRLARKRGGVIASFTWTTLIKICFTAKGRELKVLGCACCWRLNSLFFRATKRISFSIYGVLRIRTGYKDAINHHGQVSS